jgi:Protein of unknown function (DUF3593)/Protein of unknown function (DUF2499)
MISPSDPASTITALPSSSAALLVSSSLQDWNLSIDSNSAEALAGPFFGLSLFPYLAFLYFLSVEENQTPKGVVAGFATCLLFVFLSIPAAIAAKVLYGESLANCDWLHSSAESLLTLTNLVLVVSFRQALEAKESGAPPPPSSTSYGPAVGWVAAGTALATATVLAPALSHPEVHTPYLGGFLDLPFLGIPEPDNALTVATWIVHVSSLVEFLVAMGFCWRWADAVRNPTWKGLTWGLLPLHSSGITACTYHLFYNRIALLVPLQALLTCVGNATAAYAAYRVARSNGWSPPSVLSPFLGSTNGATGSPSDQKLATQGESPSLVGFEDLGDALRDDNDYSFLLKLFVGCGIASYVIKYGETFVSFPEDANVVLALAFVFVPSGLNAFKWYKRSMDPTFEGWF